MAASGSHHNREWAVQWSKITIGNLIGSGAFGDVYKAKYLGVDLAAKKLKGVVNLDSIEKEFEREVSALKSLRHPNIVLFMGIATDPEKNLWILTEYVRGGSLSTLLANGKADQLPWHKRLNYSLQVAKALAYMHDRGLIHRDLKAENVLIDNKTVKLADFGLARRLKTSRGGLLSSSGSSSPDTTVEAVVGKLRRAEAGNRSAMHQSTGAIPHQSGASESHSTTLRLSPLFRAHSSLSKDAGTLWWRAPEVDTGIYNQRADIFSLGVFLAEVASGQAGDDIRLSMTVEVKEKGQPLRYVVDNQKLSTLQLSNHGCPAPLEHLIIDCCNPDPTLRPSMEKVIEVLSTLLARSQRLSKILIAPKYESLVYDLLCESMDVDVEKEGTANCEKLMKILTARLKSLTGRPLTAAHASFLRSHHKMTKPSISTSQLMEFLRWYDSVERSLCNPLVAPLWRAGLIEGFLSKEQSRAGLLEHDIGNVVVRISTSRPGSLSVDILDRKRSFRPVLVTVGEETFRVGTQAFTTLEDVLTAVRAKAIYPDIPLEDFRAAHDEVKRFLAHDDEAHSGSEEEGCYEMDVDLNLTAQLDALARPSQPLPGHAAGSLYDEAIPPE
mmetsp:Transcript_10147/g.31207  ORF Transcript_10147/g.31207 Transcript_10147/m.31207 type:complete len:611 (-) Transcript_10147:1638-3470(-)|eukprot:CAMPEP_0177672910 /NCGR_PEP_ID=MMETSP0447-20121125/25624_1 /TAXON_ID=0 /ORGANISM="Stygamoeba regulata, Strain BSH-02190019" /LENGTH=610 /DNA_ID=CAMNT_0019180671 /DNA_START=237 /DNA_END=2069 /DNA_ORIENTATION=-